MNQSGNARCVRRMMLGGLAAVLAAGHGASAWAKNQASPQFPKRGLGATVSPSANGALVGGMNSNWYYTWGRTLPADHTARKGEFIPMAWNGSSVTNPTSFAQLTSHSSEYIMAFNEPERAEQANMTVAQAIALWPQLMATGKKLVSPGVGDDTSGKAWLDSFMSEINRLNYRVDAIAMHWYGNTRNGASSANGFISRVDYFHNRYLNNAGQKYPIWVTEFGGIDWTNGADPVTPAMNEAFLSAALPLLDSRAHVHKYAWFAHRSETSLGSGTSVFTPTGQGHIYNGRTYAEGQTYSLVGDEAGDVFYLRGGAIQNTTTTLKTLASVDAIDGTSEFQGTGKWEVRDGTIRVRTGATLRKIGTGNEVDVVNTDVINDGTIIARQGTLRLSTGTVVSGGGTISLVPEGSLALTGSSATVGTVINNKVALTGGQFFANTGSHILNGELQITNPTSLAMNGALAINQPMTGAATLTKIGNGTFTLNVGSNNSGNVVISGGTLQVTNATGSAHGAGLLTIGATSTLTGDGRLAGLGVVLNGRISPSSSTNAPRAMRFESPLTFSTTARAIFDVGFDQSENMMPPGGLPGALQVAPGGGASSNIGFGLADRVESTSTIVLDGTLELRLAAQTAGLGTVTLIEAHGITGAFDLIEGTQIPGDPAHALAVTYSPTAVRVTKALVGDANLSGAVTFDDLVTLADCYESTGRSWTDGDFNGDSVADFEDLVLLAGNYGMSPAGLLVADEVGTGELPAGFADEWERALGAVLVPEPTTMVVLPGMMLLALRRR